MKLSLLKALLDRTVEPRVFLDETKPSLREYKANAHVTGSVMPVHVTEDCKLVVSKRDVCVLCDLFVKNELDYILLAYIADAMQLAELVEFETRDIAGLVAEFTDPEINSPFSKERAAEILNENHK